MAVSDDEKREIERLDHRIADCDSEIAAAESLLRAREAQDRKTVDDILKWRKERKQLEDAKKALRKTRHYLG